MKYLLDTHVLLWLLQDDARLSEPSRRILFDRMSHKYVSVVSLWEIAIKTRIGKLELEAGMPEINKKIDHYGFGMIGLDRRCVEIYNTLPLLHRDPFDGMLVATASLKEMTIITADENIHKYTVKWVW